MFFRQLLISVSAAFVLAGSAVAAPAATGDAVASLRPASVYAPAKPQVKTPKRRTRVRFTRQRPSVAMLAGLRDTPDPLELSSSVAYMADQDSGEVFFEKNADVRLPIASVTKLMTALVIVESELPMKAKLRVTRADYVKSRAESKLRNGMVLTREATLQAALMSSDNRAAHMLARTYPGGVKAFVKAMNEKAAELGMTSSRFTDPTGLSNENISTARDLGLLAAAAHGYAVIRKASTTPTALLNAGISPSAHKPSDR